MSSVTKILKPSVTSLMYIGRYFRFTGLGGNELVYDTTLQDDRGCTLTSIVVLKLHETCNTSIGGFKPSLRLEDTDIAE